MRKHDWWAVFAAVLLSSYAHAQVPYNSAAPNGYTKKAIVAEQVGLTQVTITYHRPAVRGREGKIWGGVVHEGFADQGFGSGNPAPWRAGANETTVIEFDRDVKVEGQALPKGRYGLFVAYGPSESVVVFSRKSDAWGSFFYDESDDALRVKVKPQPAEKPVEYLKYEFTNQTPDSAVVVLSWDNLSLPFRIEVDHLRQQFDAFVAEAQNPRGFTSQGLTIAANWTLQNNYNLEKGLEWATLATGQKFPGDPTSFPALSTRAAILEKLGRSDDAAAVIKAALPFGTVSQSQQLGRQLLAAKKPQAALEVFRFNHDKHPDHFVALMGMVRGLSANGQYKEAETFATRALPLAPDDPNRQAVQGMIEKLKRGEDVN